MNLTFVPWEHRPNAFFLIPRRVLACLIVLIWWGVAGFAQSTSPPTDATVPFSGRVTHLMGFADASKNANGTLSIRDSTLQFQKDGQRAAEVEIPSVQDVFLGGQSRQVGGTPMTVGKVAAPFGGGRVVSLFAHKKYDTLTLEYVDANGGLHGATFQLNKGQGEILRNELVARGAHVSQKEDAATRQNKAEIPSENK